MNEPRRPAGTPQLTAGETLKPAIFRVDAPWFRLRYPQVRVLLDVDAFRSCDAIFLAEGFKQRLDPCRLFSTDTYLRELGARRAPLPAEDVDVVVDYLERAGSLAVSCHWLANESFLRQQKPAIQDAISKGNLFSAYFHYVQGQQHTLRPSAFLHLGYAKNKLGLAGNKPFEDFLKLLDKESVSGSAMFDPEWYAQGFGTAPLPWGIKRRYASALEHFLSQGIWSGRSPIPDFDADFYLKRYPDVAHEVAEKRVPSAIWHFVRFGAAERRDPNPYFDTAYYCERYPMVAAEVARETLIGPFEHFLMFGLKKKMKAHAPLVSLSVGEKEAKTLFEKFARIDATLVERRKLAFKRSEGAADVTIVIPVLNRFDFTLSVLAQIHQQTQGGTNPSVDVVVVDNGSTDETAALEKYVGGIRVVRTSQPVGYPRACNLGAKEAAGKYLLFVNNDIRLGWDAIRTALEQIESLKADALGATIYLSDGTLQEQGSLVFKDGSAAGIGRGQDGSKIEYQHVRSVDYVSGCFFMVSRATFESMKGFDEIYSPGYYEETDFCAKLRAKGGRILVSPDVTITHYEYGSFASGRPPQASWGMMGRNRATFVRSNADFLAGQPEPPQPPTGAAMQYGAMFSARDRNLLFVEDLYPIRGLGSGFTRARDILEAIIELGWHVVLFVRHPKVEHLDLALSDRLLSRLNIIHRDKVPGGLQGLVATVGDKIDVIWTCRTHNYPAEVSAFQTYKSLRKDGRVIFDTEAISSAREQQLWQFEDGSEPGEISGNENDLLVRELEPFRFADGSIAVNDVDAQLIRSGFSGPIWNVGHVFDVTHSDMTFAQRKDFLLLGAVHGPSSPNYDALHWFANKVWPKLREKAPDARLLLAGYWDVGVPLPEFADTRIETLRDVANLDELFARTRVFVAPTRFAAGLPHKVQHALSRGVPAVISTLLARQLGAEGEKAESAFIAAETGNPEAFVAACAKLYQDETLWNQLAAGSKQLIAEQCSKALFVRSIEKALSNE